MLKFISNLACHGAFFVQISKHLMLKFIFRPLHSGHALRWISKHLMLKFIPVSVTLACLFSSFQNILCWSLSEQDAISTVPCTISKHLMLKFITRSLVPLQLVFAFQNILCWSLSVTASVIGFVLAYFKTSYVEVYQREKSGRYLFPQISKHLMLKFITDFRQMYDSLSPFQNILCWSLSRY